MLETDPPALLQGPEEAAAPGVAIVIVNWNSGSWLRDCLRSIQEHGGDAVAQVIVVDNGSSDGSDRVDEPSLPLTIIRTGANLGFARACNMGARQASARYLLFFNPDAALGEESLQTAVTFMESREGARVGVCGIRLIDETGSTQHHTTRFPTPLSIFRHERMVTAFDHLRSRPVDHVIGAFYLVRRGVFEAVGGFDERFFVYFEDLDLSLRIRALGWEIFYLAEAAAFHKGGGTSERVKAHRLFYSMRSRALYAFKHFHAAQAWAVALGFLLIEPSARIARAMLRRSPSELHATLRGSAWFWRDFRAIVRRRAGPVESKKR